MIAVGIDVSKGKSTVTLLCDTGKVLKRRMMYHTQAVRCWNWQNLSKITKMMFVLSWRRPETITNQSQIFSVKKVSA